MAESRKEDEAGKTAQNQDQEDDDWEIIPPNPTTIAEPKKETEKYLEPIDVEIHCAVPLRQSRKPCRRSLLCKSHSFGAKRAVAGRSAPFDQLWKQMREQQSAPAASQQQET
ncbi:SCA7, zinc-binding domain-containing protein [Apodospora peruviana]|uniref:SCA7, zinc-binding domain-containing protein n=1 Tax=Apodospora peruviana TaxID=516989 RepID=A0AAE0HU18_9PEZI|nr:SCA7, zinc-binding domain-containing protein [Apodospora peruviana]